MKIKKKIIAILAKNGGTEMFIRGLEDRRDEFRAINFRRAVHKALEDIVESEKELAMQCNLTEDKNGNLKGDEGNLKKFREFQEELYKEDVEIECKPISFESWRNLKKDNIALAIREVEEALWEGFWLAPSDEDNNS